MLAVAFVTFVLTFVLVAVMTTYWLPVQEAVIDVVDTITRSVSNLLYRVVTELEQIGLAVRLLVSVRTQAVNRLLFGVVAAVSLVAVL